jgi:hypothetical protein
MLSIKDMNTPVWEEFKNSVNTCCMNSVLFIRTKNPQNKCHAIYKNDEREFKCGKTHLNLREIKFCNNVMKCIETNNHDFLNIANACNIEKCVFYPCKLKPIKVVIKETIKNIFATISKNNEKENIISKKFIQENVVLDSLNLENIEPKLFSIWRTKYKHLTCEQINNIFLKKKEEWIKPHIIISKNKYYDYDEWREEIIEMETKHERTKYADFWSYFQNILLENDKRIIGNANQVLLEHPDIFEKYIDAYWKNDERNFDLNCTVTFSDWLLTSDYSNIFKYMLDNKVTFKEAKQILKPINNNKQEANQIKLMNKLLEQERKENQEIEARNILTKKFLEMNFLPDSKNTVNKKSQINVKKVPEFINTNTRYDFNLYVIRDSSKKLELVVGPINTNDNLKQLIIKYKNKLNALIHLLENNYIMISCTVKSIKDIKSYSFILDKLPQFISDLKSNNCIGMNPSTIIIPITNNNHHKEIILTEIFEFQPFENIQEYTDNTDNISVNGLDVAEYINSILT